MGPRSQLVSRADTPLAASQALAGLRLLTAQELTGLILECARVPSPPGPHKAHETQAGSTALYYLQSYAVLLGTVTGLKGKLGSGNTSESDV